MMRIELYRDVLKYKEMYSANNEKGVLRFTMLRVAKNQSMEVFAEKYLSQGALTIAQPYMLNRG